MAKSILVVATTVALSWLVVNGTAAQAPTSASSQSQPSTQPTLQAPTGDAKRGKELFEKTYRCYTCHGFDGQTGSPRLVPMARTQESFIGYVRKPSTQGMPKFPAVPEQDLADVYAYVRSIPVVAPPLDSIPLLKDVIDRRATGR
jgi:mono/diheme cytochrome c family protein